MNLTCYMGENVAGIGYQFYGASGLLGSRVTAEISNPFEGVYYAAGAAPPAGTLGVRWTDGTGLIEAEEELLYAPVGITAPFETTRRLITSRMEAEWDPALFRVAYDNQTIPKGEKHWGIFSIAQGQSNEMALGGALVRGVGMIYLRVMVAQGAGSKAFYDAADAMTRIFNNITLREGSVSILTRAVGIAEVGPREGYTQRNIICPFQRDDHPP